MLEGTQERANAVRAALREITAECGREALSSPGTMSNLVKDLLPDDQQIARLLVVAAEQQIPGVLQDHVSHGMDVGTATRLVASSFAASTLFAQPACTWVVSELAVALGLGSAADLNAVPLPSSEPVNSGGAPEAHTVPAPDAMPSADTLGRYRRGGAPGAPESPHLGRRKRSLLAVAAAVVLAVVAGAVVLLKDHGPGITRNHSHRSGTHHGSGAPLSAPNSPQGTFSVNRQVANNGKVEVTLTTISVKGTVMTVDLAYRNLTPTSQPLSCLKAPPASRATVALANGTVLHASRTFCSDHPNDFLIILGPRSVRNSYAIFSVPAKIAQPFTFTWPNAAMAGSVSGIRLRHHH